MEAARAGDAGFAMLEQAAHYDGGEDFIDYNRRFHCALAGQAANRRLAAACVDVIEQSDRLVRVSLGQIKGRQPDRLVAEHRAILATLRRGDGRAAAGLLRAHIDAAEARVMAALRQQAVVMD
jgi:DNA-binding GntR family transcriptional regulator